MAWVRKVPRICHSERIARFADAVNEIRHIVSKRISASADAKGYLELAMAMDDSDRSATVALASELAGNRKQAFEYLEKAYSDGDSELLFAICYPGFDRIRSDPRFKDLMRRLGLPE